MAIKLQIWCDSHANRDSRRTVIVDLTDDLHLTEDAWGKLTQMERLAVVRQWFSNQISYGIGKVVEED